MLIRPRQGASGRETLSLDSLLAGVRFVRRTKLILATITLDLFAVLLGGATALLPVFVKDILHVGPEWLGWLWPYVTLAYVLVRVSRADPQNRIAR